MSLELETNLGEHQVTKPPNQMWAAGELSYMWSLLSIHMKPEITQYVGADTPVQAVITGDRSITFSLQLPQVIILNEITMIIIFEGVKEGLWVRSVSI